MVLIAQTGWGQEADRRRTQAAGFDFHLVKPINHAELSSLLAGISAKRANRESGRPSASTDRGLAPSCH
jgi:CheY-like chemotaxis protein